VVNVSLKHQTRQRAQIAHTSLGGPPLLYQHLFRLATHSPDERVVSRARYLVSAICWPAVTSAADDTCQAHARRVCMAPLRWRADDVTLRASAQVGRVACVAGRSGRERNRDRHSIPRCAARSNCAAHLLAGRVTAHQPSTVWAMHGPCVACMLRRRQRDVCAILRSAMRRRWRLALGARARQRANIPP